VKVTGQAGSGQVTGKPQAADRNRRLKNYEVHELKVHAPAAACIKTPLASPRNQRPKQAANCAEVSPPKVINKPIVPDNHVADRAPHPCSPTNSQENRPYINTGISTRMYANFPMQQTVGVSVN